ncbi:hypothetical protein Taro_022706 [Colocasia esculenta]|uniref:Uncharacterized protein n=1 Tax=Colocasia esculenta TaxID=4460 RepID=A0A843V213_COLES|nr:hypothetical protein [Colocasia esculenta]
MSSRRNDGTRILDLPYHNKPPRYVRTGLCLGSQEPKHGRVTLMGPERVAADRRYDFVSIFGFLVLI